VTTTKTSGPARIIDWLFRSRQTGRITIVQLPNWSLGLWLVTSLALRLADPSGGLRTALVVVSTLALLVWAADELLRGVNPFRRLLGAAVLVATAVSHLLR
jgi:hypothetical protein